MFSFSSSLFFRNNRARKVLSQGSFSGQPFSLCRPYLFLHGALTSCAFFLPPIHGCPGLFHAFSRLFFFSLFFLMAFLCPHSILKTRSFIFSLLSPKTPFGKCSLLFIPPIGGCSLKNGFKFRDSYFFPFSSSSMAFFESVFFFLSIFW